MRQRAGWGRPVPVVVRHSPPGVIRRYETAGRRGVTVATLPRLPLWYTGAGTGGLSYV